MTNQIDENSVPQEYVEQPVLQPIFKKVINYGIKLHSEGCLKAFLEHKVCGNYYLIGLTSACGYEIFCWETLTNFPRKG